MLPAAQRVWRDSGLGRVVLAPVQEYLPGPQASAHGGGDQCRHALLELFGHPPGQRDSPGATDRFGQRRIEVQTLAAAGEREDRNVDVLHQLPHRVGHLRQPRQAHPLTRVEIEYQTVRWTGLSIRAETPLRHMDFQGCLLSNPGKPDGSVDDRIDGRPGAMLQDSAAQPRRRRLSQLLLEEGRRLDPVRPALTGGRPTGNMRQHHLGDGRVVPEHLRLRGAGDRIEHLVRVAQRDQRSGRRSRWPHLVHRPNVLPR